MDTTVMALRETSIEVFASENDNTAPEVLNADGSKRFELQQQRFSAHDDIRNQQAMMQQIQL